MISKGIDKLFGDQRLSYRRITAWLVGCAALPLGFIDGEQFVLLTVTYIGSDSAVKALAAFRGGNG
jgi:hypothetical protein|tara:strand:+ start:1219 stop:1416 length:198 start_codon:yes stop_codon:yes gene_type:complete